MKPDTSRKKLYTAKLHEKNALLHVHASKDLKARMKKKVRSLLVQKGDRVRVMRGSDKGKDGKVMKVNHNRCVVFVEALTMKSARGKETFIPFQPSNLLLIDVNMSKDRKEFFSEGKAPKHEAKPEHKAEHKAEEKPVHAHEHKAGEHAHIHEHKEGEKHEHAHEHTHEGHAHEGHEHKAGEAHAHEHGHEGHEHGHEHAHESPKKEKRK